MLCSFLMFSSLQQLRNEAGQYLLEEVFLDLGKHFEEIFTSRWLGINLPVDTICATLEDYFQDYNKLVEANFKFIIKEAYLSVIKRYLNAMFSKRVVFKTYKECEAAANQVLKETEQLKKVFESVLPEIKEDDPFHILIMLAEVLKSIDDMLSFDLHRLVEKYPDITEDQLLRLLYLRGDVSRSDAKEKVSYVLKTKPKTLQHSTILKEIARK